MTIDAPTITALGQLIGIALSGIAAIYAIWAKQSAEEAKKTSADNSKTLGEVVKATDGMKEELVKATDKAAHATGREEGRIAGTAEGIAQTHAREATGLPVQVIVANTPNDPAITKQVK